MGTFLSSVNSRDNQINYSKNNIFKIVENNKIIVINMDDLSVVDTINLETDGNLYEIKELDDNLVIQTSKNEIIVYDMNTKNIKFRTGQQDKQVEEIFVFPNKILIDYADYIKIIDFDGNNIISHIDLSIWGCYLLNDNEIVIGLEESVVKLNLTSKEITPLLSLMGEKTLFQKMGIYLL